jgi:hypothetical protein
LVEILGPMVEKCDILGCFRMERPLCVTQPTLLALLDRFDKENEKNKIVIKIEASISGISALEYE